MEWSEKNVDWVKLVTDIQQEVDANKKNLEHKRLKEIQHHLDYGEFAFAFEFLMLDIMEFEMPKLHMSKERAIEIGLTLDLNISEECLYDIKFWEKFMTFLGETSS